MVKDLPLPAYGITEKPDGYIQDQYTSATTNFANNGQPMGGWGCVNDEEPVYVDGCPGHQDKYNYWIYYQIPAVCEVPVQFTIYSGNTVVLTEACSTLYPAVVTDTILDSANPAPYLDGVRLPSDSTDASVPVIELEAQNFGATDVTVYYSDLGTITAKDDCDPNPSWEINTGTLTDGQAIPIGTPHLVQVDATDWKYKMGVGYIKVLAIQAPTASPVPPTPPPTSTPSLSIAPSSSLGPSLSIVPSVAASVMPSRSAVPTKSSQPSSVPSSSPTAIWCPDWSGSNTGCTTNCEPWMHDMGYSYLDIGVCCRTWYGGDLNQCLRKEDPVKGAVEGGWYVNWQKILFDDATSCCSTMLAHQDTDLCVRDSSYRDHNHYTNKYYVHTRDMQCVKDCEASTPGCGGSPYDITVSLYDSQETCCAEELSWLSLSDCILQSSVPQAGDTQMWFREELNTVQTMTDVWQGGNISPFRHEEDLPGWPSTASPFTQAPTKIVTSPPSLRPVSSSPTASPSSSPTSAPSQPPTTSSPTASPVTASPTKSPVVNPFSEVGDGHCEASSGDNYDYVAYIDIEYDICPGYCMSKDNGALVGYEHYAWNSTRPNQNNECRCLWDNGNVNLPETELGNVTYDVTLEGTGAISAAVEDSGEAGWWKCHSLNIYDPAQVPFSYVGGGYCQDMASESYSQIKFGLGLSAVENAAACMSACLSQSTSANDLVGYSAATFDNPVNDKCLCLFKAGTLPSPCPDSALECKDAQNGVDLIGQYPARLTAGPELVDCYRYNVFDGFAGDAGALAAFNEVTDKYLQPTSGYCLGGGYTPGNPVDAYKVDQFREDGLFTDSKDGEKVCYEYCKPFEVQSGYLGFLWRAVDSGARCVCYFETDELPDSSSSPALPASNDGAFAYGNTITTPLVGNFQGQAESWDDPHSCYYFKP
ncbi:hypothetical protein THAOC_21652 [Thalassiosira oceanica]|uniref:Uncharacterized protein n=1 Tax=Thalassiosira oceanica TaxID=159749 RepID=K0SBG5_THAOC|nr:hypothetical protein THAOC_21652 [Thalassiosira oceanica]|eukprot:EJK58246.1 hypothetical protein THAOC_21652 [Thalassiosira oceanica]